jgi:hypothetical protein
LGVSLERKDDEFTGGERLWPRVNADIRGRESEKQLVGRRWWT